MRPYTPPQFLTDLDSIRRAFSEVSVASHSERAINVMAQFSVTNASVERRALDADTATNKEICEFLATMVSDFIKEGGGEA